MVHYILFAISLSLFVAILYIFSKENLDYVSYSLVFALLACILTSFLLPLEEALTYFNWISPTASASLTWLQLFINMIEFKPLMFIMGMQILVVIAEKYKIFQWIAVKSLHFTKGNHRTFFYMICIIATITAALIADVTVAVVFVPLVIRACRILKINPAPYLYGITITINIGSILTPFSSSKNILISSEFSLNFLWFLSKMGVFIIITLAVTLILLDLIVLRKNYPPTEERRKIFLEIMNPDLVIGDRKKFLFNSLYFILVIVGFTIFSQYSYLIAFFGGILLTILNQKSFIDVVKEIDLKVIFFFIALFLLIGTMELNGTFDLISLALSFFNLSNVLFVSLGVLIISSLFSGLLASNPTAVLLIIVLRNLFPGDIPDLVLIAFFFGINLGGNLLPQGATCDLMTLNIAKKSNVKGFTYKSLFKVGGLFALIHIILCMLYIVGYYLLIVI